MGSSHKYCCELDKSRNKGKEKVMSTGWTLMALVAVSAGLTAVAVRWQHRTVSFRGANATEAAAVDGETSSGRY